MKKLIILLTVLVIIVAAAVGALVAFNQPPFDPAVFEPLLTPAIKIKPDQRVIEVTVAGNPNNTAGGAIGLLYSTLYAVRGENENVEMAPPRARWPLGADTPKEQWVGRFAVPVPGAVETLPEANTSETARVQLTTWKYGETAEILHIGPYDAEKPTIEKLEQYIAAQGYVIAGDHEEEYLRGPGWFFAGDPRDYYTIIRYQVRKQTAEPNGASRPEASEAEAEE